MPNRVYGTVETSGRWAMRHLHRETAPINFARWARRAIGVVANHADARVNLGDRSDARTNNAIGGRVGRRQS